MKKQQLTKIIKEEIKSLKLKESGDGEELGGITQAFNYTLEELVSVIKNLKNPEIWVERYPTSAQSLIDQIDDLGLKLGKINATVKKISQK